jgi:tRNA threonylcarbamoyladenosine biosynthesis protein TsaB
MLVLALDTAVEHASAVLADGDREVAAWRADAGRDLCRRLAPELAQVVDRAGRTFDDLDLVAVGLGPGSFTALRVGLATAKAVALARDLPLVGISSLAAMAWQVRNRLAGLVCPMLDARRGEIYAALYRTTADGVEVAKPEFVAAAGDLAERLACCDEQVTLFGQLDRLPAQEIASAIGERGRLWREENVLPDALAVAQLGHRRCRANGADDAASLRPIYVRMSYAEERFDIDLGLR